MKTHCMRGHALVEGNFRTGRRECLQCHRSRGRNFGPKRTELPNWACGHPRTTENTKGGHPACKTCHRADQLKRYRANPVASIAAASRWANANRDRLNARIRSWRRDSPAQQARASLRGNRRNRDDETIVYAALLKRDPCSYCGGLGGSLDHITPITRGGATDWENLTAACRPCNSSKNARPLIQFLAAR